MMYRNLFLGLLAVLFLTSCASYRKSVYLRHDEVLNQAEQSGALYEYRIQPKDELVIVISTTDPASSVPFMRKIGQSKETGQNTQGMNNANLLNYLVDNNGCIDYPVLGSLQVSGLTARACEALIRKRLEAYLNEVPNVSVRIANFRISVLGEVAHPGTYTVSDDGINIFQALAQAGDMTLFADRDDVQLLREDASGRRKVIHLDLTESGITLSPYYQLQQNDVVYVKPTKGKVRSNTLNSNSSFWMSLTGVLTSIASLIIIAIR